LVFFTTPSRPPGSEGKSTDAMVLWPPGVFEQAPLRARSSLFQHRFAFAFAFHSHHPFLLS
jgi:hypothetical protein